MNCIFSVMNYLGHAVLSYNEPSILVGNMISDFVKGSSKFGYPASIQKGIALHREIDNFTDAHPSVAKAKDFFRPHYRLYSSPIVDIVFDNFIANDASLFAEESLLSFTDWVYDTLEAETIHLPMHFLNVLTYMKAGNWLYNYRTAEGIKKSLQGLARRASYMHDSTKAFEIFMAHYNELQKCYEEFMPAVKQMAKQKLGELLA